MTLKTKAVNAVVFTQTSMSPCSYSTVQLTRTVPGKDNNPMFVARSALDLFQVPVIKALQL